MMSTFLRDKCKPCDAAAGVVRDLASIAFRKSIIALVISRILCSLLRLEISAICPFIARRLGALPRLRFASFGLITFTCLRYRHLSHGRSRTLFSTTTITGGSMGDFFAFSTTKAALESAIIPLFLDDEPNKLCCGLFLARVQPD